MIRSPWQRSRLRRRHPGNDLLHPAPRGSRPAPRSPGTPHSTGHPPRPRPGPDAAQMWQWEGGGKLAAAASAMHRGGGRVSGMEGLGVSPRTAGTAGTRGQECPRGHTPATRSCRGTAGTNGHPGVPRRGGPRCHPQHGGTGTAVPFPTPCPPTITKGPLYGHREARCPPAGSPVPPGLTPVPPSLTPRSHEAEWGVPGPGVAVRSPVMSVTPQGWRWAGGTPAGS